MSKNGSARVLLNIRYPMKPIWARLLKLMHYAAFSLAVVFLTGVVTDWIAGPTLKLIAQVTAPLLVLTVILRLLAEAKQAKDQIALADNAVIFQKEQLGVDVTEIDYLQISTRAYRGKKSGKLLKYSGWENQLDLMLTDGRRCEAELLIPSAEEAELLSRLDRELGYLAVAEEA